MASPILAQTIGFELEVEDITRNRFSRILDMPTTSDASVESDGYSVNGIPLVFKGDSKTINLSKATMGMEILSQIIDTEEEYLPMLKNLCHNLICMGESEQSKRSSFHVHLSYSQVNLRIIKSVLKLGAHLEDVFFLLGGMGYTFRGIENDATYCRPITPFGPQIVKDRRDNLYPCFVLDDLLESNSMEELKVRLGDIKAFEGNKYIPMRYTWLNLYNLFGDKGTLEFRTFNKSLNPMYLFTVIEISKYFGQYALATAFSPNKSFEANSVFDYRSKPDIVRTFTNFADEMSIPGYIVDLAIEIMDKTPIESIRLPKEHVYSHLMFHRNGNRCPIHWELSNYRPSVQVQDGVVRRPNFLDIHNLRAQEANNSRASSEGREASPIDTVEEIRARMRREMDEFRRDREARMRELRTSSRWGMPDIPILQDEPEEAEEEVIEYEIEVNDEEIGDEDFEEDN